MNFFFKKQQIESKSFLKNIKLITFSSCFYILKSKFPVEMYLNWIKNFVSIVNNFNLVIYTNKETLPYLIEIIDFTNKNVKIILKPLTDFYTYKYKDNWIKNHEKSTIHLHKIIDWELNMLWNEKLFLVNETIKNKYFKSMYYGWCDIGYFRNRNNDLHSSNLKMWPNPIKLLLLNKNESINYGCVQNDLLKYNELTNDIVSHYKNKIKGSPTKKYSEICFAGGFFILNENLCNIYVKLYEEKLEYYFKNEYFIKDDQTIIQDIILTNPNIFQIHKEDNKNFDNWFMFQRLLL